MPISFDETYPRPQLRRTDWVNLDGVWDCALDPEARWTTPSEVVWDGSITVPFAPETPASGIGQTDFLRACWYRRTIATPALAAGDRAILHFGAVDDIATVWVNGQMAGSHVGGYTPFRVDITPFLTESGEATVIVRAEDDPHDLGKPRGKQDWQRHPHVIWYPRTTGIWQTVWLERVPRWSIASLRWSASVATWSIELDATIDGPLVDTLSLSVTLRRGDDTLVDDRYTVIGGAVRRTLSLPDPGIDSARDDLLWSPDRPTLIEAELVLRSPTGEAIDTVQSYTAMRSVHLQGDRFLLNGRPLLLRLVLDQGYWPETGLTPPDSAALRRDVELALAMGFNGVRKHQKLEDPRFLARADQLGLLVWSELPSAYTFSRQSVGRAIQTWREAIDRDISHPCIVAWVPINESWGVPDLPLDPAQRHYVQALYFLTKALDPSRPVIGNDGWESVVTDILAIHDYDADTERLLQRYSDQDGAAGIAKRQRPQRRQLTIDGYPYAGQPVMLTEFGGIAFVPPEARETTWGYDRVDTAEEFAARYARLLGVVHRLPLLSGFCYTQFTDTYQEANGLLTMDRTPKIPLEQIRAATDPSDQRRAFEAARRRAQPDAQGS